MDSERAIEKDLDSDLDSETMTLRGLPMDLNSDSATVTEMDSVKDSG